MKYFFLLFLIVRATLPSQAQTPLDTTKSKELKEVTIKAWQRYQLHQVR